MAQPRDDVEVVTIGDEVVLLDGWRSATVTNKAGASIWSTLGQAETIGAVAESLAREFGAPVEVVTNDVVDFVRQAAVSGLLKNAPRPEHPHGAGGQPPHLMAGDSAPSTQLWHTNGRPCSLADTLGRESLLVNWNPHCGFCARLVDRIAVLAEPLKAAGIPLALVAYGSLEDNDALCTDAKLDAPLLIRDPQDDVFHGAGTPAAFHLDSAGVLLSDPAYGVEEVMTLLEDLAPSTQEGGGSGDVRYLMDHGGLCAPGSTTGSDVAWADTRTYRFGEFHIGIRADNDTTAGLLDRLFPDQSVDDPLAGYSFSIALGSAVDLDDGGGSSPDGLNADRRMAFVDGGSPSRLRSRSARRVVQGLLSRIDQAVHSGGGAIDTVRVKAIAVVADGTASLLPFAFHAVAPRLQAMLAQEGIALADAPLPEIDTDTAELVIHEPAIAHDADLLQHLFGDVAPDTGSSLELPAIAPGRYPLTSWCATLPGDHLVTRLSPAAAAAATMSSVEGSAEPSERLLRFVELFQRVQGYGLWYHSERELRQAVANAVLT